MDGPCKLILAIYTTMNFALKTILCLHEKVLDSAQNRPNPSPELNGGMLDEEIGLGIVSNLEF